MESGSAKKILIWVVAILVVIALGGWFVWQTFIAAPNFHAVSLTTGEVYFGELQRFPTFGLEKVYTLQINQQNQEQPLSIQKFENIFWGPQDFLEVNRDNVVWMVELKEDSQLTDIIRNNPNLQSQQAPQGTVPAGGNQVPESSGGTGDATTPSGN